MIYIVQLIIDSAMDLWNYIPVNLSWHLGGFLATCTNCVVQWRIQAIPVFQGIVVHRFCRSDSNEKGGCGVERGRLIYGWFLARSL